MQDNKIRLKAPKAPAVSAAAAGERRIIRIADTDIEGNKKLQDALRAIDGLSFSFANAIIKVLGIPGTKRLQDIDEQGMIKLKAILHDPRGNGIPDWMFNWRRDETTGSSIHLLGNDLKSKSALHIQMIKTTRSYLGYRHSFNYKLRGQRVRSRGANFKGRIGSPLGVTKKAALQAQPTAESKPEAKK
jgi:small subunit ribosomal protein S13